MSGKPTITGLDIAIGLTAKKIRTEQGFSQEQAAEGIGCSVSQLSQMERGNRSWSTDHINKAAKFYKVPVASLVGESSTNKNLNALFEAVEQDFKDDPFMNPLLQSMKAYVQRDKKDK